MSSVQYFNTDDKISGIKEKKDTFYDSEGESTI